MPRSKTTSWTFGNVNDIDFIELDGAYTNHIPSVSKKKGIMYSTTKHSEMADMK